MRILVALSSGGSSLVGSELYSVVSNVLENFDNVFAYILVPPWARDGFSFVKNVKYITQERTRSTNVNKVIGFDFVNLAGLFSRQGGQYQIDVIMSDDINTAHFLQRSLSDPRREKIKTVYVGADVDPTLIRDIDVIVFSSKEKKTLEKSVYATFRPSLAKDYVDNIHFVNPGRKKDEVYDIRDKKEKTGRLLVLDGNTRRKSNISQILYIMDGIKSFIVSRSSESAYASNSLFSFGGVFGLKGSVLKPCSNGDAFIILGDMNNDDIDAVMCGVIPVCQKTDVNVEILGENYPFFFNKGDSDDSIYMIASDAINSDFYVNIDSIINERTSEKSASDVFCIINRKDMYHPFTYNDCLKIDKVLSVINDGFYLYVFVSIVVEKVTRLKPWGNNSAMYDINVAHSIPTVYDLMVYLKTKGYVDNCKDGEVFLELKRD